MSDNRVKDLSDQLLEVKAKHDRVKKFKAHEGYVDFEESLQKRIKGRKSSSIVDLNSLIAFVSGAIADAALLEALNYGDENRQKIENLEKAISQVSIDENDYKGDNALY